MSYKYKLTENNKLTKFQQERISAFDEIEKKLNNLYPQLSNSKSETVNYYKNKPGSWAVVKPTDLILDYITDIENLLKDNQ